VDSELFHVVTKKLEAGDKVDDIRMEIQSFDLVPESFVQCWYNPSLVQLSKDKILESCVRATSSLKKPGRRLTVSQEILIINNRF
jgi:hypothetical protein